MNTDTFTEAIKILQYIVGAKDHLPDSLLKSFERHVDKLMTQMSVETEGFLHHLDISNHSENGVRTAIKLFPDALSKLNVKNRLPIQQACYSNQSTPFIPVLAEEGVRLKVGGERAKGGLLLDLPCSDRPCNIFQAIAHWDSDVNPVDNDSMSTVVLRKLKELGFLQLEDIKKFDLVHLGSWYQCRQRFGYLTKLDPEALTEPRNGGRPLLQKIVTNHFTNIQRFEMVLQAGLRLYPQELGFLFKSVNGQNACDLAFEKFGREDTARCIQNCIPIAENYHPYTRLWIEYFTPTL